MKKVSLGKKLSIAGKDVLAVAFISQGINLWNSGNQVIAAILLVAGGILFLVDQYA
jgi:hypothetical protein